MEVFVDRAHAGRRLAEGLASHPLVRRAERLVVLAVPRGGLPVAAEVAPALGAPVDVAVLRRLRSPHNPELAFGAVGPNGHLVIDRELTARLGLTTEQIDAEIEDRSASLQRRLDAYRAHIPDADLTGATVVVVDDGIATGSTVRGAIALARHDGAAAVLVAVPVAPRDLTDEDLPGADALVVLTRPAEYLSVSQAYQEFPPVAAEDAIAAVAAAGARNPES